MSQTDQLRAGRWNGDRLSGPSTPQTGRVGLISRVELAKCNHWRTAFSDKRKDNRYYELVEDTIPQDFEHRYFAIKNEYGAVCAVQPFFILAQDLVAGVSPKIGALMKSIRRVWPHFLKMRTLMVGCTP